MTNVFLYTYFNPAATSRSQKQKGNKKKKKVNVPITCLERAMTQCDKYIQERCHDDIDVLNDVSAISHLKNYGKEYLIENSKSITDFNKVFNVLSGMKV